MLSVAEEVGRAAAVESPSTARGPGGEVVEDVGVAIRHSVTVVQSPGSHGAAFVVEVVARVSVRRCRVLFISLPSRLEILQRFLHTYLNVSCTYNVMCLLTNCFMCRRMFANVLHSRRHHHLRHGQPLSSSSLSSSASSVKWATLFLLHHSVPIPITV